MNILNKKHKSNHLFLNIFRNLKNLNFSKWMQSFFDVCTLAYARMSSYY